MKIYLLTLYIFFFFNALTAQNFEAIPQKDIPRYTFNFKKNFFENEEEISSAVSQVSKICRKIEYYLDLENLSESDLVSIFDLYDNLEKQYRVLDLYYFLKYAINVEDYHSLEVADSIRNIILPIRIKISNCIVGLSKENYENLMITLPNYSHFIKKTIKKSQNQLSEVNQDLLSPFEYLKDNRFYNKAIQNMVFEKVETENGQIDVISEQSLWENHKDPKIRDKAEETLLKGYNTQKDFLAYNYINFIKGQNAFSKAEGYHSFIEKKLAEIELDSQVIKNCFRTILLNSADKENVELFETDTIRFDIHKATQIITNALSEIGNNYKLEVEKMLNPKSGRIDIVGGENRVPIRGTASVFPIKTSIFYAQNYEGYLIDLTLLAHEIGHAVQAALMFNNNVSMVNATGPAYFTESFGKFNELLLFDYLSENEKNPQMKKLYKNQLRERMNVIYGSTVEAAVEYNLIDGILKSELTTPENLDSKTYETGLQYNNERFKDRAYLKGFWMLLQTNFIAPLHNINDMLASILAVNYFKQYKMDKEKFLMLYNNLLKNGYINSPEGLLSNFDINLKNKDLIQETLTFIKNY